MKDAVDEQAAGSSDSLQAGSREGSVLEVFKSFAILGFTCFGGPVAHLAYFRHEFVTRRRWLSESAYADLVALCQFLPGPASSKLGFSLGVLRGGAMGGLAAWTAFTLPSAIFLVLFAFGAGAIADEAAGQGLFHGLKLVAVAIVAHAVWGMSRRLAPDRTRASICAIAAATVLIVPHSAGQLAAILLGGVAGVLFCRNGSEEVAGRLHFGISRKAGAVSFILLVTLLAVSLLPLQDPGVSMFSAFYRSGALVFGGGHVVLPLLSSSVVMPGWVSEADFLAGYGAAQAVPGPLFTFAAYLGAIAEEPFGGWPGAGLALFAIFLPGILVQISALAFWEQLRKRRRVRAAMRGVNAAVVGVLAAALYSPVWTSVVREPVDFAIALIGFVLLLAWNVRPLVVVAFCAAAGVGLGVLR